MFSFSFVVKGKYTRGVLPFCLEQEEIKRCLNDTLYKLAGYHNLCVLIISYSFVGKRSERSGCLQNVITN